MRPLFLDRPDSFHVAHALSGLNPDWLYCRKSRSKPNFWRCLIKETLTTEQIVQGLKHYRRIARQDLLRAPETPHPQAFTQHAEARRAVYAELAQHAEQIAPDEVLDKALALYRALPFVTGTAEFEHADVKGRENALENFFLMAGLDPKRRREARSARPKLKEAPAAGGV